MRNGRLLRVVASAFVVFLAAPLFSQQTPTDIQTEVIEDFTDAEESRWVVRGSRFIADGFPRVSYVETGPDALYLRRPDVTRSSLGVNAAFNRTGFNYLQLVPVAENEDGEEVDRSIPIPGTASTLDLWVWGSNYDMYVDVHLRDHRGIVHVVRMGDLTFNGWRNLSVRIPPRIPQSAPTLPRFRPMELTKVVIWTRPGVPVSNFYVYLDEIRVLTDMYQAPFDGSELANPDYINELWSNGNE